MYCGELVQTCSGTKLGASRRGGVAKRVLAATCVLACRATCILYIHGLLLLHVLQADNVMARCKHGEVGGAQRWKASACIGNLNRPTKVSAPG